MITVDRITTAAAALTCAALLAAGGAGPAGASPDGSAPGDGLTAIARGAAPRPGAGATTVPFWTGHFTDATTTYSYDMVGTDPRRGGTTVVPTEILPLRLHLADGSVLDATPDAADAANSPLFRPAAFDEGLTQYGDAMRRGEFWSTMAPDYHVLLGRPQIPAAIDLTVPATKGSTFLTPLGVRLGRVDQTWLLDRVGQVLADQHVSPASLPIVLAHNVNVVRRDGTGAFIGVHGTVAEAQNGNGDQPVQTFVYATSFPHFFAANADVQVLSHEVAEWLDDPFADNVVPGWSSPNPAAAGYGCSDELEVGDPLLRVGVAVDGYHLQDEAFLSWFTRETPSSAINGQYSLFGTFTQPAPRC